jgi:hypothetical protein
MNKLIEQLKVEAAKLPKSKAHRISLKLQTIEQILAEPETKPEPAPAPAPVHTS